MGNLPAKVSPREMEILAMLWKHGPLMLSEAHARLGRPIGYTTVQTRLNRMVDKGLVKRSDQRPARYEAAVTADDVSANQLDVLLERVTEGNVVPLVAQLVNDRSLTADELAELKQIIQDAEQRLEPPAAADECTARRGRSTGRSGRSRNSGQEKRK